MKKKDIVVSLVLAFVLFACNNESKDSVEKADSANISNQDTASKNNIAVIDEESSSFLVRVANSGMAETQMASTAQLNATYQPVKDFAAMLYTDHSALNEQVKALAGSKGVVLPTAASEDKQKAVNDLKTKTGKDVDKSFLTIMVDNHQASIDMFEKAVTDVKDADVKTFAEKTLPTLRAHLDAAKKLQSQYK